MYKRQNQFYVEEGNKRVSVLKYCGAVSVPGTVTRIIPKKTDEKENKIYYESVSYTHLDVYKRQRQRSSCLIPSARSGENW